MIGYNGRLLVMKIERSFSMNRGTIKRGFYINGEHVGESIGDAIDRVYSAPGKWPQNVEPIFEGPVSDVEENELREVFNKISVKCASGTEKRGI